MYVPERVHEATHRLEQLGALLARAADHDGRRRRAQFGRRPTCTSSPARAAAHLSARRLRFGQPRPHRRRRSGTVEWTLMKARSLASSRRGLLARSPRPRPRRSSCSRKRGSSRSRQSRCRPARAERSEARAPRHEPDAPVPLRARRAVLRAGEVVERPAGVRARPPRLPDAPWPRRSAVGEEREDLGVLLPGLRPVRSPRFAPTVRIRVPGSLATLTPGSGWDEDDAPRRRRSCRLRP